jgi:hypothetical protein
MKNKQNALQYISIQNYQSNTNQLCYTDNSVYLYIVIRVMRHNGMDNIKKQNAFNSKLSAFCWFLIHIHSPSQLTL